MWQGRRQAVVLGCPPLSMEHSCVDCQFFLCRLVLFSFLPYPWWAREQASHSCLGFGHHRFPRDAQEIASGFLCANETFALFFDVSTFRPVQTMVHGGYTDGGRAIRPALPRLSLDRLPVLRLMISLDATAEQRSACHSFDGDCSNALRSPENERIASSTEGSAVWRLPLCTGSLKRSVDPFNPCMSRS